MESVTEVLGLEPMARYAGLLAHGEGVGSEWIVGDLRARKTGCRPGKMAVGALVVRKVGRRQ
jgi:hypothetical protein